MSTSYRARLDRLEQQQTATALRTMHRVPCGLPEHWLGCTCTPPLRAAEAAFIEHHREYGDLAAAYAIAVAAYAAAGVDEEGSLGAAAAAHPPPISPGERAEHLSDPALVRLLLAGGTG